MKKIKIISVWVFAVCAYIYLMCCLLSGDYKGGISTTEKTPFAGMDPFFSKVEFCVAMGRVEFKGVWLERTIYGYSKENVAIPLKISGMNIQVKRDPSISGTLISVEPTFFGRLTSMGGYYSAKEITIWVSTEKEKVGWEKWINEVDGVYADHSEFLERTKNSPPSAKKIMPPE